MENGDRSWHAGRPECSSLESQPIQSGRCSGGTTQRTEFRLTSRETRHRVSYPWSLVLSRELLRQGSRRLRVVKMHRAHLHLNRLARAFVCRDGKGVHWHVGSQQDHKAPSSGIFNCVNATLQQLTCPVTYMAIHPTWNTSKWQFVLHEYCSLWQEKSYTMLYKKNVKSMRKHGYATVITASNTVNTVVFFPVVFAVVFGQWVQVSGAVPSFCFSIVCL